MNETDSVGIVYGCICVCNVTTIQKPSEVYGYLVKVLADRIQFNFMFKMWGKRISYVVGMHMGSYWWGEYVNIIPICDVNELTRVDRADGGGSGGGGYGTG